jgi:hypothetical protein
VTVAVKVVVLSLPTGLGEAWNEATVRPEAALTVRVVPEFAVEFFESYTCTVTLNMPVTVGVQESDPVLEEEHPVGRPV